jgi:hypothetical protein
VIPLIGLAAIAVAFLFFLAFQVWKRYSPSRSLAQPARLQPIDLEAFENLTDPKEEEFLRTNLSGSDFRALQRDRVRAAKMYVAALSQNARILVAFGQSARHHHDPEIAAAGQEILQRAIKLKLWCMFSLLRLNSAIVFPAPLAASGAIARRYLAITYLAANLPTRVPT